MKEWTTDVCGMRLVGGKTRNGSEWWSEQVSVAVLKREELLKNGCRREMIHMAGTGLNEL